MRITRFERNRKKKAFGRAVLVLFIVVVPLTAIAASFFFINMYNKGNGIEASLIETPLDNVAAFKYNYEIESKVLYRIELKSAESFEEAETFLKSIKSKKLNGFIVKENGYKVIYGIFADNNEAVKVQESIAAKVIGSVTETRLQGYSLKYNEDDGTFIQLVQAADKLIWDIARAKSQISKEIALKSKSDMSIALDEISKGEVKLEKYLGYAEKIKVPKEQKVLREAFEVLLQDVLAYRLDGEADYYRIQDSLLNQLQAYRKYVGKLSI